jgi:hypothetical protein
VTLSDFQTQTAANQSGNSSAGTALSTPAAANSTSGNLALETENPIDSLDITVSATGTYAAFHTFLNGIESSLRQLDVVNVNVKDSTTGVYTYQMTIRLYWLH